MCNSSMVSNSTAVSGGRMASAGAAAVSQTARPDARRWLQLGLAALWLLDGVLQYQSALFTRDFGQMLAGSATGNPGFIAGPITWAAGIVERHPVPTNAAFATIQLLLGLGIAFRPTVKAALAASVAWSAAVWWFGEGLGGILNGGASPLNGAPGAVILYALAAVLLWPDGRRVSRLEPFVAARPFGAAAARALWLILWGSLAYFAVAGANRSAQGLHDMVAGMGDGEPGWLASVNRGTASVLDHRGLAVSIVLAVLLAVVAAGVYLPAPLCRVTLVLAVVISLVIWVVAQDIGEMLTGGATDPNSGPLLVLLALAYWPSPAPATAPAHPEEALAR